MFYLYTLYEVQEWYSHLWKTTRCSLYNYPEAVHYPVVSQSVSLSLMSACTQFAYNQRFKNQVALINSYKSLSKEYPDIKNSLKGMDIFINIFYFVDKEDNLGNKQPRTHVIRVAGNLCIAQSAPCCTDHTLHSLP